MFILTFFLQLLKKAQLHYHIYKNELMAFSLSFKKIEENILSSNIRANHEYFIASAPSFPLEKDESTLC